MSIRGTRRFAQGTAQLGDPAPTTDNVRGGSGGEGVESMGGSGGGGWEGIEWSNGVDGK